MDTRRHILFIVNPIAGGGKAAQAAQTAVSHIDGSRYSFSVEITRQRGDATKLALQAVAAKTDIVVAVGGDGTVNEVARALLGTDTALGIIPCGSGNGLALHIGMPLDTVKAVRIINEGKVEAIDSGTVNGKPFFCTMGVGYDAKVAYEYAQAGTRGMITYVREAVTWWTRYEPEEYTVFTEEETLKVKALLITCANANQWGNNCHIAPDASISDGLLDITIVHPVSIPQGLRLASQLPGHSLNSNANVTSLRSASVRIERAAPDVAHYDGEAYIEEAVLDVKSVPASLKAIIP